MISKIMVSLNSSTKEQDMSLPGRLARRYTAIVPASLAAIAIVSAQPSSPERQSGIYLEAPNTTTEPARLETSMPNMQVDGLAGAMLTGGLKKPHIVTKLSGESSSHRASTQPTFLFVFADAKSKNPKTSQNGMAADMSALPITTSSPKNFSLLRLTVADGQRQYDSSKSSEVKFRIENLAARTDFRVRPESPLEPGEYGFAIQGGSGGMIWDFGVDGAK
jgi:hypothetical protein